MPGDSGFLVEEFIDAITTQLDRVQDTLRLKAVNRPLTYALKDLQLDLKVFIDMDREGRVRFRSAGAEDAGASVVHFGFTTITKPMIDENTISMSAARSASLNERVWLPISRWLTRHFLFRWTNSTGSSIVMMWSVRVSLT